MNIFKKLKASLRYSEAVRKADEAHLENGSRYYVMPMADGKLLIVDRPNFRKFKQKGYIPRLAKVNDLEAECFYCTPYKNGQSRLTDELIKHKRKSYFSWVEKSSK